MKSLLKLLTGHSTVQHTHYAPAYDVRGPALMTLYMPGARYIATKEGVPAHRAEEIAEAGVKARGGGFDAAREAMLAKAREIKAEGK